MLLKHLWVQCQNFTHRCKTKKRKRQWFLNNGHMEHSAPANFSSALPSPSLSLGHTTVKGNLFLVKFGCLVLRSAFMGFILSHWDFLYNITQVPLELWLVYKTQVLELGEGLWLIVAPNQDFIQQIYSFCVLCVK